MPRKKVTMLARRIVALAAIAVLAYPPGASATVRWVADHDMVDIPYVRDCRGIYRHPVECHRRGQTARSAAQGAGQG
jgi:hypothetical protein